ncbi:MAG TPA: CpaF family protein [Iamia sp.]|nr:CpaF family protein [Iamia sp.]
MGLSERLAELPDDDDGDEPEATDAPAPEARPHPATPEGRAAISALIASSHRTGRREALRAAKERVRALVLEDIAPRMGGLEGEALQVEVRAAIERYIRHEDLRIAPRDRRAFADEVYADTLGYGPLEPLLFDESVTEIMCNGYDEVWVERDGRIVESGTAFADDDHYRTIIERIVSAVGRRVDESSPMVDARLPDGSRVNAVIPPLAVGGAVLTIRKFAADPLTAKDLVDTGTYTDALVTVLDACVRGRLNLVVSGGTGTGKTTNLNVMSSFVPDGERIITIEDSAELQLQQRHVVGLEARPPNAEGRGEVLIRDLVRNALRMRPDRIIVGECRAAEALDMLQAMNTGHEGSMTTVHANTPRDALSRLETMVLMAGFDLPVRAIREQIAAAIDVILQVDRLPDGRRVVTHLTEVQGLEGDSFLLQDVFQRTSQDAAGRLVATGLRPKLADTLEARGVGLPAGVFRGPRSTTSRTANGRRPRRANGSAATPPPDPTPEPQAVGG